MITAGYILVIVGFVACLVGEVMMLTVAYKRGLGWFLACLLLAPLVWLLLLAVEFKAAAKPFAIAFGGLMMAGIGGLLAGLD